MTEQWMVYQKSADFKGIGERFSIDPVTARIIRNREVTDMEEIRQYLFGTLSDLHDPMQLKDVDKMTDILIGKIREKKPVRIIGDYDIDGVMSTYLLYRALTDLGANVSIRIPERVRDGYGLNRNLIDQAKEDGIDTVLTCDNGISAIEEIAYAKSLGMTVLVTDHHTPPYEEKDGAREETASIADAIVNPHQKDCGYPYQELCGAGVAWKMLCLLYRKLGRSSLETEALLEFVAFATVGDVVDLTGENRILVKEGLKRLHRTENPGMKALIARCRIAPEQIDTYHIGFVLGPCINASGRLDTARRAFDLLCADNEADAARLAEELVTLNEQRKDMTKRAEEEACAICSQPEYEAQKVLVVFMPTLHESVAGIVAGRLRERFYKPSFVITRGEDGVKGSGRSIEGYSMYEEMCKCRELFTRFGGHPMAAGFSLAEENIPLLRQRLNELAELTDEQMIPKIYIDVPMPVGYATPELVEEFSVLAPFGKGNPKPVFADRDLFINSMQVVGKNQNVLRLTLRTADERRISAVYFGNIDRFFAYLEEKFGKEQVEAAKLGRKNGIQISVIYFPKIDTYYGANTLQFEIAHYR